MVIAGKNRMYSIRNDYLDWFVNIVKLAQEGRAMLPDGGFTGNLGVWFDAWFDVYGDGWDVLDWSREGNAS